jgi:hypothetical protein
MMTGERASGEWMGLSSRAYRSLGAWGTIAAPALDRYWPQRLTRLLLIVSNNAADSQNNIKVCRYTTR